MATVNTRQQSTAEATPQKANFAHQQTEVILMQRKAADIRPGDRIMIRNQPYAVVEIKPHLKDADRIIIYLEDSSSFSCKKSQELQIENPATARRKK